MSSLASKGQKTVGIAAEGGDRATDPFTVFFLQRLHEALFDYSADSFKAPALNSHLRVVELRTIGGHAQDGDHIPASIESFFDELDWSIKEDPILRGAKKELIKDLLVRAKSGWGRPAQFIPAISALELQFNNYFDELKFALLAEAENSKWSKQRVIQLLDCLIVELELLGFPRGNVYSVTQKINSRKKQGRLRRGAVQTVELFFKHFGSIKRKYAAHVFVATSLANLIEKFPGWARIPADKWVDLQNVRGWSEYLLGVDQAKTPDLVAYHAEVLCAQSASRSCLSTLDRIAEQISFIDHHLILPIHDKVFCVETRLSIANTCPRPASPLHFVEKVSPGDFEVGLQVLRYFFTDGPFANSAKRRLARAFEYHSAALSTRRSEDQLLNLWACVEGFVGVTASAGSKIAFVRESVLSSLSLLYPQRLFSLVTNRLIEVLGSESVAVHFQPTSKYAAENFEKLAVLLLCPEFETNLNALASEVAPREPVLLYRLFELRKRFETPEVTKGTIVRHRQKVAWQLNRIYWNRNLIVHSAESLPYLSTLVEHLHIYIDSFLGTILMVAAQVNAGTIPSVLELIGVHEKHRLSELDAFKRANDRSAQAVLNWVFGEANILKEHNGISP